MWRWRTWTLDAGSQQPTSPMVTDPQLGDRYPTENIAKYQTKTFIYTTYLEELEGFKNAFKYIENRHVNICNAYFTNRLK